MRWSETAKDNGSIKCHGTISAEINFSLCINKLCARGLPCAANSANSDACMTYLYYSWSLYG